MYIVLVSVNPILSFFFQSNCSWLCHLEVTGDLAEQAQKYLKIAQEMFDT